MNRDEALLALASGNSHTRFLALRCLEKFLLPSDSNLLLKIKANETDLYIKKRIEKIVSTLQQSMPVTVPYEDSIVPDDVKKQIRAEAIEWVAGLVLHEIGSKLGLLASEISVEVPNYEGSNSKLRVEQLQDTFDGIGELKKATSTPQPIEMDLASFIRDVVAVERTERKVEVSYVGPSPMIIFCDRGLLALALCNGIKNAMDAAISVCSDTREPEVIVSWGQTDIDKWITVIDNGPGLPMHYLKTFVLGETTKRGHLGFGLGIARQAIETLYGNVELRNSVSNGATFELRWSF